MFNNTVYQLVGDAVRLENSARNVKLFNNILWVQSGYDIFVATNSQTGFVSNYNLLHKGVDINARVGSWGNANRDSLADWQTASGQDANSLAADPLFVDIDGADNILGYTTAGGGINGGNDDNFHRLQNSPATDRGDSWNASRSISRVPRPQNDTGTINAGPTNVDAERVNLQVSLQRPEWHKPLGEATTKPSRILCHSPSRSLAPTTRHLFVSTEGFLQFGPNVNTGNGNNSATELALVPRIAGLWDNLRTNNTGDNSIWIRVLPTK